METATILEIDGLSKTFGPTKAVVDLSMSIRRGEVRGLIGENGSGKSTTASMIAGSLAIDTGTIRFRGDEFAPKTMLEARAGGVAMLVQEIGTINNLSVAENIFLGKEQKFSHLGVVNKREMNRAAAAALANIGVDFIKPDASIDDVSFEDRKLVEIATAMMDTPELLIVDETTTALSQAGRDKIYELIQRMKSDNRCVIFISHDLHELEQVCDSITILRDGEYVDTLENEHISVDRMRQLMIGRDLTGHYYREDYDGSHSDEVVLKVEGVSLAGYLDDVSLELHRGEILGIGGLTDCGMHELCKVMFGAVAPDAGAVTLVESGTRVDSAATAARNGMAFLPKNREEEGLMPMASVKDNIVLMSFDDLQKAFLISPRAETALAEAKSAELNVKAASIEAPVRSLSGGNKQKVVLAKWLANESEILIMDSPTRGIDVGVKAAIYDLMVELKRQGKAIVMVSEEMPELIGMSDNLLLLKDGRVSGRLQRSPDIDESTLIDKII